MLLQDVDSFSQPSHAADATPCSLAGMLAPQVVLLVTQVAATPTVTAEVKVKTESKEHKAHDGHHKHKHDHHHKHHHKAEHKHGHKHSYAKADKDKPAVKQEAKVKREKKEYDMPGQTRDTPAEVSMRQPLLLRLFVQGYIVQIGIQTGLAQTHV